MENTTKSRRLRIAAWILGVLTVLPAAVSCGDTATAPTPDAQTQAKENVTVEEAETENPNVAGIRNTLAKLEGKDYGGVDFVIMDRSAEQNPNWVTIDVFSEGENGDTINDAVYQRNRALEENLNIHIKDMQEKIPSTTAKKLVTAGDSAFDLMTDGLNDIGSIVSSGCLMNLDDVPGLQLSNPWWDQQMNAELSVAGKHFFCTGDISIMDNYGTWCFMFNKTLAQNYDMPDFYQLVRDGKWTFDAMYDAAKQVAFDLDGNGKMEEDDQWGLYTEDYNNYAFFAAGNEKIIQKDKDDMPVLAEYTARSASVMEKLVEIQQDLAHTMLASRVKDGTGCDYTNECYGNGKGLFMFGGMWLITKYRGYDLNFGVLPTPKYDEAQAKYLNTYSYANCTAYGVPVTAKDPEMVGTVTEAMAELSVYTLTPAYYEISLKGKFIRDEESADMLDIILAGRTYDLGMIFNWGNMFSTIMSNSKADFASSWEKKVSPTQKAIDKFIDAISDLD